MSRAAGQAERCEQQQSGPRDVGSRHFAVSIWFQVKPTNAASTGVPEHLVWAAALERPGRPDDLRQGRDQRLSSTFRGHAHALRARHADDSERAVRARVHVQRPSHRVRGGIAKPANPGMSEIQVIANGKPFKFPMRIKLLPNPAGFVGASKGGRISAAAFKAQGGLIARLEDSEFQASFRVVSYVLGASGGAFPTYQQQPNESNRWTGGAKAIVDRATPGTTVFFDDIRVVGPDNKVRQITPMVFQLQ